MKNEVDFLPADKQRETDIILSVWVASHVQITQNKKFAVSVQYLKKGVSGQVDFWHADKHEGFLQIDTMIFDGDCQVLPKFPK